jgi:glycosyltransferase involved in cell wall biosynthesis
MNVLYHLTSPTPAIPETDAVFQEIGALQGRFGGRAVNLYPLPFPTRWFPPGFLGLHRLPELRRLDRATDVHHVFHPLPRLFPVLRRLRKPIVYSVIAGLDPARRLPPAADLRAVAAWVVARPCDAQRLLDAGATRCRVIRPGLDLTRFTRVPPPPPLPPFTILAGSAPWVTAQFRQKGFDLLLDACARHPDLRLVLLWRGLLEADLRRRVAERGMGDRVEIVNRRTDVADLLGRCHAAVVLAEHPRLVKAFPHSLLEALAAGRPILASACIPISDYIRDTGCGEIVTDLTPSDFDSALTRLRAGYEAAARAAREVGGRDFALETMLAAFQALYDEIAAE